ncbi:hypothetical protein HDE_05181 [Halotydeus destructor]|nr:hypothetical protein HDE_05181 [Halotydeus destructor]
MKVLVSLFLLSIWYGLAYSANSILPEHRANMWKNETYGQFVNRIIDSGIYTLPGNHCFFNEGSMGDQFCRPKMDSCCYVKFKWVCYAVRTKPTEGKCNPHKGTHRPASYYLNTTKY